MAKMVSIIRTSREDNPIDDPAFHAEHDAVMGGAARITAMLPDPNTPGIVAVLGEVDDLAEVRRRSRTPEGDAMMRKWGFIEQLAFYTDAEA